jgi:hypothetical protein
MSQLITDKEEYSAEELTPGPLDKYGKKDQDYTPIKHLFRNDDQYQLFCMLPGGDDIKYKVLQTFIKNP